MYPHLTPVCPAKRDNNGLDGYILEKLIPVLVDFANIQQ